MAEPSKNPLECLIQAIDQLKSSNAAVEIAAAKVQRIREAVDKLRDETNNELTEQTTLLVPIRDLQGKISSTILSPLLRQATDGIFTNYQNYREDLARTISFSTAGWADLHSAFEDLGERAGPMLSGLDDGRELSDDLLQRACDVLTLRGLELELRIFKLRRDTAFALLEAPIYGSIAASGIAMRRLLGVELDPYWDWWALFKAGLADLTGAVVPVTNTVLELNRQTIVDIDRNINKIVTATSEVEKLFLFDEQIGIALGILKSLRDHFPILHKDLRAIADHEFTEYVERLARYMSGEP